MQTKTQKRISAIELKKVSIEYWELLIKYTPDMDAKRLSGIAKKIVSHKRDIENTEAKLNRY
jgi:hypothetical protein